MIPLDEKQIKKELADPFQLLLLESTTSTNDVAKEQLKKGMATPFVVATNKQTAGRGRLGRSFYSELAHGLYFSLAFQPGTLKMEEIPLYTILAAAALVETLEEMTDKSLSIKWVNDIFYKGRKISGILSEMVSADELGVVVGIGINFAGDFSQTPQDIQEVAGTLFGKEAPPSFNQNAFLRAFIERFMHYHQEFEEKAFMEVYEKHLLGVGKKIHYVLQNQKYEGTILGINQQGHLEVQNSDGTLETLYSQEVHFSSAQFLH